MSFLRRIEILGIAAALFLAAYGISRHYSPPLIAYVVEQTLIQKAPEGTDEAVLRNRFNELMRSQPDAKRRMETLLAMSSYLEKTQRLTRVELDRLFGEFSGNP